MLNVEYTSQFKRDLKLSKRRNYNLERLYRIMRTIESEDSIKAIFKDHPLSGDWHGHRELQILSKKKTVIFVRVGTYADLFS